MGEWNETCMMTRLPILPGESVIGLLLTRRSTVLDRSYPDGEYTPSVCLFSAIMTATAVLR